MKNTSKVLSILLLLTFSVVINQCVSSQKTQVTPKYVEEAPKTIEKIYFKDGKVIQCGIVWEGTESDILCKKSDEILAYSTDEVDLVKTFEETDAKEIAKRCEKIKGREESVKILKSIGTESKYMGGPSSFSTDEIKVSSFGVTKQGSGYYSWVASCVVRNLTSAPIYVRVYIQGVTSDGFILKRSSISSSGKIWGGEYEKCSSRFGFSSDDNRITKWEIYKIWSKAAYRYK